MKNKNKKYHYKFVIGLMIGLIVSATVTYVFATYASSSIYYSGNILKSSTVQGAIDELAKCPDGKMCIKKPANNTSIKLGDYVIYNPTTASYTLASATSGTTNQVIYPSTNLRETSGSQSGKTLWRVIRLNSDGTVELISYRVTNANVTFAGLTGYLNFVGALNDIAAAYETNGITVGHRHFGYSNQTQKITDISKFTNTSPWICSTTGSCRPEDYEYQGGGDTGHLRDYNLLQIAFDTSSTADAAMAKTASQASSSSYTTYWMASRNYSYVSSSSYFWEGRAVLVGGNGGRYRIYGYSNNNFVNNYNSFAIRPIVVLSADLTWTGAGTYENPWVVSAS